MARQFDPETLELMRRLKEAFDPAQIFNPGKLLPGRGCAEIRQPPLARPEDLL